MPSLTLTPEQVVDQAVAITAEFETRLAHIDAKRRELLNLYVKKGETRAIDRIRIWLQQIFLRVMGK